MARYLGEIPISGRSTNTIANANNLLDFKWSDHLINNIEWLRGDTFSWQSGSVYITAYNHLVADIQNKPLQSETIGEYTIQYYKADDGHKICPIDQERNLLNLYSVTGVAWYYVLDTTNARFKLPRTQYGFVGLRDEVGKFVDESLPNITGTLLSSRGLGQALVGAFYTDGSTTGNISTSPSTAGENIKFDASLSSSTYQDNEPVQQKSTQMYLYFYVGQYSQTAIEQTAGLNSEMFNDKVDVASLYEISTMLASYVDGDSGYNIWSNGYCEQWGYKQRASAKDTITLTKIYNSTNYNIMATFKHSADSTDGRPLLIRDITANSFQINSYTSYAGYFWKTCGYLAVEQY